MVRAAPPLQPRSRRTLERILVAATELLAERGENDFTIAELALKAGTSVGTIYRRFATKEDVLLALLERVHEEEETELLRRWAAEDWNQLDDRAVVGSLVHALAWMWREHAPVMRAAMARRLQQREDSVFQSSLAATRRRSTMFTTAVLTRRDRLSHADAEAAACFAWRLIEAACARWAAGAAETQSPSELDWDEMLAELAECVSRYLFSGRTRS